MKQTIKITNIDILVGKNLKIIRLKNSTNQLNLAKAMNITTQQIQKYEKGKNRISCGRIFAFAKYFNVPIQYFFDENLIEE